MNIHVEIPRIPQVSFKKPDIKPVVIPKINIPNITTGTTPTATPLAKMDVGYKKGYDAGFSGSSNLSDGEDTVNNDYWLGYSCGHRDGTFDRENGNAATC